MLVHIEYTTFNLGAGTESIKFSDGARRFFLDYGLEHCIEVHERADDSEYVMITWSEEIMPFEMPGSDVGVLQAKCSAYGLKFVIFSDKIRIHFEG